MTKKNQHLKFEKTQEKEMMQAVVLHLSETEQRLEQKRKEFEDVKQCGTRLTKHRFSY
ncbi:hypothetical protein [Avibacterium paragallinarum]|uniref:hypothetical protein n=1 Tax=Avibacterium paragallinarum TaxID=728 RepID=UPI001314F673|nr:hypothetical protein [Avibacterium paragallinarum]WAL56616.1 hypothetical protein OY678_11900 [Avibacterium paragallinarum]